MQNARRSSIWWVGASVVAFVVTMFAHLSVTAPRRKFNRFLSELGTVELGKTNLTDFRVQMEHDGLRKLAFPCHEGICGYSLQVENTLLHKLKLAPVSIANASVGFTDGVSSEIYITFEIGGRGEQEQIFSDKSVVIRQTTENFSNCDPHYHLTVKHNYRAGRGDSASVGMDACVSSDERKNVLAINSACLTRIGGCKGVEEMIPQVFPHN